MSLYNHLLAFKDLDGAWIGIMEVLRLPVGVPVRAVHPGTGLWLMDVAFGSLTARRLLAEYYTVDWVRGRPLPVLRAPHGEAQFQGRTDSKARGLGSDVR